MRLFSPFRSDLAANVSAWGSQGRLRPRAFGAAGGLLFALLAAFAAAGCNETAAPAKDKRAEVFVNLPIVDDEVIDFQDFTGRLDAIKTVEIRARVSGYITVVPFKEG